VRVARAEVAVILALVVVACEPLDPSAHDTSAGDVLSRDSAERESAADDTDEDVPEFEDCTAEPNVRTEASAAASAAATSANQLGLALLTRLEDPNSFLAPLNITTALGMVLAGAAGDTRAQMRAVLAADGEDAELHAGLAEIEQALEGASFGGGDGCPTWSFHGGSAAFADARLDLLDAYAATLADPYGVEPQVVDYARAPAEAAEAINAWASDATEGRVDDIAHPEDFDEYTLLVLGSAVHFAGGWSVTFDRAATEDGPFQRADGSTRNVPLMTSTGPRDWARVEGAYAVELRYRGNDLAMVLVVPDEVDGLPGVLAALDPASLSAKALDRLGSAELTVVLPRFEVASRASLVEALAAMGMEDVFDPSLANLSAMAPPPPGFENLYVSQVKHEAWIEVDELGTEAAAATTVEISGADSASIPDVIRADRPFLYVIRDRVTDAWLFAGTMDDPSLGN
jgi:serpin B